MFDTDHGGYYHNYHNNMYAWVNDAYRVLPTAYYVSTHARLNQKKIT